MYRYNKRTEIFRMYPYIYTYPTSSDINTIGYTGPMPHNRGDNVLEMALEDATDKREIVKASIQRIVSTECGERVMNPTFGSRLRRLLFEPIDSMLLSDIRDELSRLISEQEPRIIVSQLDITPDAEQSTIYVSIGITFRDIGITDTMNFAIA